MRPIIYQSDDRQDLALLRLGDKYYESAGMLSLCRRASVHGNEMGLYDDRILSSC